MLLRGASVKLTGEIWKFRTRSTLYRADDNLQVDSRPQELLFEQTLNAIDEELLQSDALSLTDFRKFLAHKYEHPMPQPAFPHIFRHEQYGPPEAVEDLRDALSRLEVLEAGEDENETSVPMSEHKKPHAGGIRKSMFWLLQSICCPINF